MRLNEQIRVPQVRLIGEDGKQLGIVPTAKALAKAQAENLDLVEISPVAQPPVCKIMDYGKYKYQQQKKLHDQRRKHHGVEMKQLRIKSFRIDPHDVEIKRRKAREFLESGHRLLFTLMFRTRREHGHADLAAQLLLEQFAKPLSDVSKMDAPPRKEGRKMTMTLSPLPNLKHILEERARRAKQESLVQAQETAGDPKSEAQARPEAEKPPAAADASLAKEDGARDARPPTTAQ